MSDCYDRSVTSGAYALGALTPQETVEFEAALAESPELQVEVAGFRETLVGLALSARPAPPSAGLRDSLLAALDGVAQLSSSASVDAVPAISPVAPVEAPLAAAEAPSPTTGEHPAAAGVAPRAASEHVVARRRPRRARPLLALVTAAAAVLLFFAGTLLGGILNAVSDERTADQFAALNAAPDVARTVTQLPGGGTAALVASQSLGMSAVVLNDATGALPEGRTFQLWYVQPSGPKSAGLVQPRSGSTYAMLAGDYTGEPVAMTIEPRAGSAKPTTTPMVLSSGA